MSHKQQQFLNVVDRDEAERRFRAALRLGPLGVENIPLSESLGRVLAADVRSRVDVPSFDRSNFDGYAVRAADTIGADEESPQRLRLLERAVATGSAPAGAVEAGWAREIATGGMLPRGADAIVMVEHADVDGGELLVRKPVAPGFGVSFAGSDITAGETVLRSGELLTARETGVLAAIGATQVAVRRRPRVAILSTGDEIIAPGQVMSPGLVFDSNARVLADSVRELGGEPIEMGIVRDDLSQLEKRLDRALAEADAVLLSGGTSKGAGDLSYRAVSKLNDPGIVAHGVALKPGKPICLAASGGKPVVILPGFPTSAIFTFHEFVAPVLRELAGQPRPRGSLVSARLAAKVNSEIGRTEYLLVGLVERDETRPAAEESGERQAVPLAAYPMGKGSGSVTTFSRADGFITIDRHTEIVERDTLVEVKLLADQVAPAELIVIGSHCLGLDYLLSRLNAEGVRCKFLAVGSTGGLAAAKRGECDLAGMHLLDAETGQYNAPFLTDDLELITGYGRMQGVVYRPDDGRFAGRQAADVISQVAADPAVLMVNRNQGSGTRILIDRLLAGRQPPGYAVQARSHNAVAAAVAQGRADWGVAIQSAAEAAGLGFLPLATEQYDFAAPMSRLSRPAVQRFIELLEAPDVRAGLREIGLLVDER